MPTDLQQPEFVLVRPQMGENIGASARAMWNFGLDRLRLVTPRDGWPNPAAAAMASGAGRLLDEAQVHEDAAQAVSGCHHVYATTARRRGLVKPALDPEAAMREAAGRVRRGERVAVLFGPERTGLENAELAMANAFVHVPVNPDFPSLNLSQCVLLMAYEWMRADAAPGDANGAADSADLAGQADVESLAAHYEERLGEAGFFFPEAKAEGMKLNLRSMWSRMPLTRADVRTLHGILRQMARRGERD